MRHFTVLGFTGISNNDKGKSLFVGQDRAKALEKVNERGGGYVRREMYELAVPYIRRIDETARQKVEEKAKAGKK